MALKYKIDIMAELKKNGYTSTRIREEKLIGQSYLQQIRHNELVSWKTIDTLCRLLNCQVGDLVEYVAEDTPKASEQLFSTFQEKQKSNCGSSRRGQRGSRQLLTGGALFGNCNFCNDFCNMQWLTVPARAIFIPDHEALGSERKKTLSKISAEKRKKRQAKRTTVLSQLAFITSILLVCHQEPCLKPLSD